MTLIFPKLHTSLNSSLSSNLSYDPTYSKQIELPNWFSPLLLSGNADEWSSSEEEFGH